MSHLVCPWSADFEDYLRDESRRTGAASSISFPASEAEVVEIVKTVAGTGDPVTLQGARTGIVAGAVPQGGHVLNLSRMKSIGEVRVDEGRGVGSVTVQPGVTLDELRSAIAPNGVFFPPDPTETSASIGGMVACNASGAVSFSYGPTRDWVERVRVVLPEGDTLSIRRGEQYAEGREFSLTTDTGRTLGGRLPGYAQPGVKSAAGYYVADDMDLIEMFIGMEGTLGVITEIELRLIARPAAINGLTLFVPSEYAALTLVRVLRGEAVEGLQCPAVRPAAIEFFDHEALDLLRKAKAQYPAFEAIPALKPHYHTALYVEFHGDSDDSLEEAVMQAMEAAMTLGGSDDDTWFATTEREIEPLKSFRHATPEAVNLLIDERRKACPQLTKLGTDMSVPDSRLVDAMSMYREGLARSGLESVLFGHIGNNHIHVNILPGNLTEYECGRELYLDWARQVVEMGGSVSAEHGIGKLKAPFLEMMFGPEVIEQMRAFRRLFDPRGLLNPGNLFS